MTDIVDRLFTSRRGQILILLLIISLLIVLVLNKTAFDRACTDLSGVVIESKSGYHCSPRPPTE